MNWKEYEEFKKMKKQIEQLQELVYNLTDINLKNSTVPKKYTSDK